MGVREWMADEGQVAEQESRDRQRLAEQMDDVAKAFEKVAATVRTLGADVRNGSLGATYAAGEVQRAVLWNTWNVGLAELMQQAATLHVDEILLAGFAEGKAESGREGVR
jgi:hypothetical protein